MSKNRDLVEPLNPKELTRALKKCGADKLLERATSAMADLHHAAYFFMSYPLSTTRLELLQAILKTAEEDGEQVMPEHMGPSLDFTIATVREIIEMQQEAAKHEAEAELEETG